MGHGNGGGHQGETSVPDTDRYRAIRQAFTCHRAALRGIRDVVDIWEHPTRVKCHCCGERTESMYKKGQGNGERSPDRDLRLCMICVDCSQNSEAITETQPSPSLDY